MQKINLKYVLPALIIAAGILVFIILKVSRPDSPPLTIEARVWQVQTIPARFERLAPELILYGQIETPALVKAAAPSKGKVFTVAVREGDPIHKGQLLLGLDPRDYQPQVMQAEARVAELSAMIESEQLRHNSDQHSYQHEKKLLTLEQSAVKRAQMLENKNMGSTAALELAQEELARQQLSYANRKLDLNDHKARLQQLDARLSYALAELEIARLDLERSQIIAPFDGFVESLLVATGDQVKENQVLLSFYPIEQLEIRAKIPAPFRNELQQIIHQGGVLSASASIAGQPIQLQLDRLAGSADATGIDALFSLTNSSNLIRLGSMISLSLQRPVKEKVIAIPFASIYDNDKIFLLKSGRLEGIKVNRIGEYQDENGQFSQLISSPIIKADDRIVITHLPNAISGLPADETNFNPADK